MENPSSGPQKEHSPPGLFEWILTVALPPGPMAQGLLGDLSEEYQQWRIGGGPLLASARYAAVSTLLAIRYSARRAARRLTGATPPGRSPDAGFPEPAGRRMGAESVLQDVRFALRGLLRNPGFAAVALLTLALGIGANVGIFSVVNGVLLRPLPYPDSRELVYMAHTAEDGSYDFSVHTPGNFFDWRERSGSFSSMAAFRLIRVTLVTEGEAPVQLLGTESAGSLFDVLDVPPLRGRTFSSKEDETGPETIAVISHGLWERAFGSRDVVGSTLHLSDGAYTIVGIMPDGFGFPSRSVDFWIPSRYGSEMRANRTEFHLRTVARLAPGVTLDQAREEMAGVAAVLREEHPVANRNVGVGIIPLMEWVVGDSRVLILILMGAVGMVLLVACVNMANLLFSRNVTRSMEMSVRRSVGADRARLIRQVLTEAGVLAALGGVAGVGVGYAFLRGIMAWIPGGLPRSAEVGLDLPVLSFAALVTIGATLLFGSLPALYLTRGSLSGRLVRGRLRVSSRVRNGLVAMEVAMAVVLLTGATLLTRSFVHLSAVDPGYEVRNRTTFTVQLPSEYGLAGNVEFFQRLEERLSALPGVGGVGFTTGLPASGQGSGAWLNIVGRPDEEGAERPVAAYRVVNPGYLEVMGIPLLRGRALTRADGLDGTPSVLVSQALVDRFFPDEEVLGREITLGPDGGWIPPSRIIGVVGNVHVNGPDEPAPSVVYAIHELMPWWGGFSVVARMDSRPGPNPIPEFRRVVSEMDPQVPIYGISSLEQILDGSTAGPRDSMILMGLLAAVALLMAAVGVFGVLSFLVRQRAPEVGIRMALGADAGRVRAMVLREGMKPILLGLGVGTAAAFAAARVLESLLFGIPARDPLSILITAGLLLAVGAGATWLPARKATTVNPVEVLGADQGPF